MIKKYSCSANVYKQTSKKRKVADWFFPKVKCGDEPKDTRHDYISQLDYFTGSERGHALKVSPSYRSQQWLGKGTKPARVDITPSKKRQFKFNNMKHYLVSIKSYMPYPVEKNYRMEASGFGTAIGRAIKLFRKEKDHKKIKEMSIKATYVSTTKTIHAQVD